MKKWKTLDQSQKPWRDRLNRYCLGMFLWLFQLWIIDIMYYFENF